MSLVGGLNIGSSALAVSQTAIQTTGNNIANAGNADYTRQTTGIASALDQAVQPGIFVGAGVDLTDISRQIDQALEGRLRASTSDDSAASTAQDWMSRIEASLNELNGNGLSTQFSNFFNAWSNLANKPQDTGLRQVVLQDGQSLAASFQTLQSQFTGLQGDVNSQVAGLVNTANGLAQQVADLNAKILATEGGAGGDNALRDQRDAVLKRLSNLIDINTVQQPNGVVNVNVGSEPLVLNTQNRGVGLKQTVADGQVTSSLIFKSNNGTMNVTGGQLGALIGVQSDIGNALDQVNNVAHGLIFELNKVHSSGQGLEGVGSVTSANTVADPSASLNDPRSALKFPPSSGSFVVHVKQKGTGLVTSTLVQVDLDGQNGDDTTLNSLAAKLSAVSGIAATVSAGKLTVSSNSNDLSVSFSQDSSGVLASLGVNNFFTGSNARDIAVSGTLQNDPSLLAASKNGDAGDNQTAVAIASLQSKGVGSFGGKSLTDTYQSLVNDVATKTANAKTTAEAASAVKSTLEAQRDAMSGVSLDEETVNLLKQQRAFQGAAKFISAIDEMMKTVIQLV